MSNNEYRTSPLTTEEVLHEVLWSKIEEARPEYRKAFEDWLAEVERAAAAKGWDEGRRATELEYEHIFHGHTALEGEMCDECDEWSINPYRQKDS